MMIFVLVPNLSQVRMVVVVLLSVVKLKWKMVELVMIMLLVVIVFLMLVKDYGVVLRSINNDLDVGAGDHDCADGHVGDNGKGGADDYNGGKSCATDGIWTY